MTPTPTAAPSPSALAPMRHPFTLAFKVGGLIVNDTSGHVYVEANPNEPPGADGVPAWVLGDIDVSGVERGRDGAWIMGSARLPDTCPQYEPILLTLLQQYADEITRAWAAHVAANGPAVLAAARNRFRLVPANG